MEIKYNGKYVILRSRDDWDAFQEIICACGHLAVDHEYNFTVGSSNTIEIGQCRRSGHCRQFKIKGRPEPLSLSYARQ